MVIKCVVNESIFTHRPDNKHKVLVDREVKLMSVLLSKALKMAYLKMMFNSLLITNFGMSRVFC